MSEKEKNVNEEVEEVEEEELEEEQEEKESDGTSKKAKTFTQEEVNKMMAREKRQGVASVYKELGFKSNDKETKKAIKEFIESRKTDAQKAIENNDEINEANKRAIIAETKAEAMQAGVQAQYVDDVVTLITAKLNSEEGLDVKTALGELKTKYPVWFEKSKDEDDKKNDKKSKTGEKGTGSSMKSAGKDKNESGKNLGARLAANRKGKGANKKSYWSV